MVNHTVLEPLSFSRPLSRENRWGSPIEVFEPTYTTLSSVNLSSTENSSLVDWQEASYSNHELSARQHELEYGLKAAEHADVWHVYNEESTKADTTSVDASNRSIDVLLVFTGLFSAVLTTFIIQSYQLMIPSSSDVTNALLAQYISNQGSSAASEEGSASVPVRPSINMDAAPTLLEIRWVNGLWFAALVCSLSAALFSMLAKQWLQAMSPQNVSGSPRLRSRQRQRRYSQTQKWHVAAVINALPCLLHISLLLFFAGLIVLLWSGNLAITVVTFVIVALVFALYFGSAWLSMVYPDFPYQHPISDQLRGMMEYYRHSTRLWLKETEPDHALDQMKSDDFIDASCLVWLFSTCPNMAVHFVGLQAIGGLPRNFTAFHVLRNAGAVSLVLEGFRECFHRDATLDSQWYVLRADHAEAYCRAWMRLTYGTSQEWPEELIEPLDALRNIKGLSNISAIAVCTRAIATLDTKDGRSLILSCLAQCTEGHVEFGYDMQCWLLDTFLQCSSLSKAHFRPKDHIAMRAVPILLRLLHNTKQTFASHVRSAIALALSYITCGTVNLAVFNNEEKRPEQFCNLMIPALTNIVINPSRYGVDDELLDLLATEFARLASLAFAPNNNSTSREHSRSGNPLKSIAQRGLSRLYVDGRIKNLPSGVLADVHQVLYPPVMLKKSEHALFVRSLLQALWSSTDPRVMVGSALRLLEPLLLAQSPNPAIVATFIEGKGIAVLLRAAQTGDTGSRRLQLDCLRNVCHFVRTTAELFSHDTRHFPLNIEQEIHFEKETDVGDTESPLDHIFNSDFFKVLNKTVGARPWWLPEIVEIWVPALVKLCELRPHEPIWRGVESTFRKFAESNEGKDGWMELLDDLDRINSFIRPHFSSL